MCHQSCAAKADTEEQPLSPIPRMPGVPNLIATDDDHIVGIKILRSIERERAGQREPVSGPLEGHQFAAICSAVCEDSPIPPERKKSAFPLGNVRRPRKVIQDYGVVPHGLDAFHHAPCLPVCAVVEALVEG